MVTTRGKNDDDDAVATVVTHDVAVDDKDEASVSELILFSHDLVDYDSSEEFVSLGKDVVDLPVPSDSTPVTSNAGKDEQVIKPKQVIREKDKASAAEKKQLKRRIRTLEEKVDSLLLKKSQSDSQVKKQVKELNTKLRAAEKSKKTLQDINDVLFKARGDLKEAVAIEKEKLSDAESRMKALRRKVVRMEKKATEDVITPQVNAVEVSKLKRQLEYSIKETNKFVSENSKLKTKLQNSESKMTILKVTAASNKDDNTLRRLELKKEMEELAITRAKQRLEEKILFEREKAEIKKRQFEAKASASEASKKAKVDLKLKEANAKSELFEKRKNTAYYHSNAVRLLSYFVNFYMLKFRFCLTFKKEQYFPSNSSKPSTGCTK